MQVSAQNGACLATLAKMALGLLKAAARDCPRTGPGRPPQFEDWQIAALIFIAVLYRRKSKSAQYRFLHERRTLLKRWLLLPAFPARSTYFARYRHAHHLFQAAVRRQGRKAILERIADPSVVAVDKSVVAAKGIPWRRHRGKPVQPCPRGVDKDAGWTWSKHDGWVWGYGFETVVTAPTEGRIFPLLASASSANYSEHRSFKDKIPQLPRSTRYVLADGAYDSNAFQNAIEYDAQDRPIGRHFLCPMVRRGGKPKVGRYPHRGHRGFLCDRRRSRLKFFESHLGQRLYHRRSQTIEPFHDWFKNAFELTDRVWHRGLENNQTQLLAAIFCYQLLVRYNHHKGNENAQVQPILDRL
jgi:hypothetical protein